MHRTYEEGGYIFALPCDMRRQKVVPQLKKNRVFKDGKWSSHFKITGIPAEWHGHSFFFGDGTVWDSHFGDYRRWNTGKRAKSDRNVLKSIHCN